MTALSAPQFHDEDKARGHLEAIRWPNGPVCPHCGSQRHYNLQGQAHRPGLLKCADCKKQYSVTVASVLERSKIPLTKWLMATYLMCSSKKGFSAHQLHRTLGVTYKTAWVMAHRIREAMRDTSSEKIGGEGTSGIGEADETYFGNSKEKRRGPFLSQKQKVVALVERKGRVRTFHVPAVNQETLKPILTAENIAACARVMTDSAPLYDGITGGFASHETVNHSIKEYVRGDVTTNTVEGYFGILKRSIGGIYQHVSKEHLNRYVSEFSFRYNNRIALDINDQQGTINALAGIEGKRLTYRRPRQA